MRWEPEPYNPADGYEPPYDEEDYRDGGGPEGVGYGGRDDEEQQEEEEEDET